MPYLIGLIIALFITLTGVGAGTITVPILVLFLGVPAPVAVSIGLIFASVVKLHPRPRADCSRQRRMAHPGIHASGRSSGRPHRFSFSQAPDDRRLVQYHQCHSGNYPRQHSSMADPVFVSARPPALRSQRPQPLAILAHVPRRRRGGFLVGRRWSSRIRGSPQPHAPGPRSDRGHRYRFRIHCFPYRQRRPLVFASKRCHIAPAIDRGRRHRRHRGNAVSTRIPRRPLRFALWVWLLVLGGQFLFNSYKSWNSPGKEPARHYTAARVK